MSGTRVNWFEIPVSDLAKATAFYETVFGFSLMEMETPNGTIRVFCFEEKPQGALVQSRDGAGVGGQGVSLYLDAGGHLDAMLARVEPAGGQVTLAKMDIGEYGHIGQFADPDGNKIGIHSL